MKYLSDTTSTGRASGQYVKLGNPSGKKQEKRTIEVTFFDMPIEEMVCKVKEGVAQRIDRYMTVDGAKYLVRVYQMKPGFIRADFVLE